MKLLHTRTLNPEPFDDPRTRPRYAVLSHTWEPGPSSSDPVDPGAGAAPSELIRRACDVALELGVEYLWAECLCVDASSPTEVNKAINSSYQWFQESAACIVHLADLPPDLDDEPSWQRCSWFTRAWTLPELLAPPAVRFYDGDWTFRGTKTSAPLLSIISRITLISEPVLRDASLIPQLSVARRMSWAAARRASRVEDRAYSLLGILGVQMQVNYGEGAGSFLRLQAVVLRETRDMSLLAWEAQDDKRPIRGLFASSPAEFARFAQCPPPWCRPIPFEGEVQSSGEGLSVTAQFICYPGQSQQILLLDLGQHVPQKKTALVLFRYKDSYVRAASQPSIISTQPGTPMTQTISAVADLDALTSHVIADTLPTPTLASGYLTLPPEKAGHPAAPPRGPTAPAALRCRKRSVAESSEIYVLSCASTSLSTAHISSSLKRSLPPNITPGHEDKRARTRPAPPASDSDSGSETTEMLGGGSYAGSESASSQEDLSEPDAPGPPPVLDAGHPFLAVADELTETARGAFAKWQATAPLQSTAYLACPFQAREPDHHSACLTRAALRSPRDVRAHVWRAHRLPHYCPVCYSIFEMASLKNAHIVRRDCKLRPRPQLDGVSEDQKAELLRRDVGVSREEEWEDIWEVLFPGEVAPSPLPQGEDGRRISLTREFWEENGQTVVSSFLEGRGLLGYDVPDEERGLAALYALVLERLVEGIFEEEKWEVVGDAVPEGLPSPGTVLSGLLPSASVSMLGAVPVFGFRGAESSGLPVRRRWGAAGRRAPSAAGRRETRCIRSHDSQDADTAS